MDKKWKGFSLLELLIAISVLASISVLILLLFSQTQKNQTITANVLKNRFEKRVLRSILEEDLKNAVYLTQWVLANPTRNSGIYGIPKMDSTVPIHQIYFHARKKSIHPSLVEGMDPEIHEIDYFLKKPLEAKALYSLYRREYYFLRDNFVTVENVFGNEQNTDPRQIDSLMSDSLLDFRVQYLPPKDATQSVWVDSWSSESQKTENRLPLAIFIQLSFLGQDGSVQKDSFQVNLKPILPAGSEWDF